MHTYLRNFNKNWVCTSAHVYTCSVSLNKPFLHIYSCEYSPFLAKILVFTSIACACTYSSPRGSAAWSDGWITGMLSSYPALFLHAYQLPCTVAWPVCSPICSSWQLDFCLPALLPSLLFVSRSISQAGTQTNRLSYLVPGSFLFACLSSQEVD